MIAIRIVSTLLLILLSALLSSCGWESTPSAPMPPATPAPAAQPVIPAAVTPPTPAPPATPLPATYGSPIPDVLYIDRSHEGKAIASVQERIYLADVVVRARLQGASNDVLRFRSVSYLKGTGPKTFTVRGETDGRPTQWDSQDAILFLDELVGETEDFEFTDTSTGWTYVWNYSDHYTGNLRAGYTLGTRNPVWLPLDSSSSSRTRSPNEAPHVADNDALGNTVSVAQSEIERTIRWTSGPGGKSAAGGRARSATEGTNSTTTATLHDYGVCLDNAMEYYRKKQDDELEFNGPRPINLHEMPLESGQREGTGLIDSHHFMFGYGYSERWLEGPDSGLFTTRLVDNDDSAFNGYNEQVLTTRPLPTGTYRIDYWGYPFRFAFCDFRPDDYYSMIDVTVTAPEGTVHEAFFDPATTTAGVGYLATTSTSTGVLEPAGFSVRGRAIAITGLTCAKRPGGADAGPVRVVARRFQLHRAGRDCRSASCRGGRDQRLDRPDSDVGGIGAAVGAGGRADDADGADTAAGGAESDSGGELCRGGGIEVGSGIQGGGKRVQDMASPAGEGRGAEDLCIGHAEHGYDVHGREQPRSQPDGVQGAGDRQGLQRRGEFRVCSGRQPVGGCPGGGGCQLLPLGSTLKADATYDVL